MRHQTLCLLLASTLSLLSCVSAHNPDQANETLKMTDAPDSSVMQVVPAKALTGLAEYKHQDKPFKAQWIACERDKSKGVVLINHRDEAGFDDKKFCAGWVAQTVLGEGYSVIAVNRPGFVASTGKSDLAGPQSIAALEAGVNEALAKFAGRKDLVGVMGYSSGTIAAAFYAKKNPNLQWMILGGGIYDLEQVAKVTKGLYLQKEIKSVLKAEGDVAYEHRSVAYDLAGLPKRIALYHGKSDEVSPPSQAQMIRDSLASSEYTVNLDVIEGMTHDIDWVHHRLFLQVLLRSLDVHAPK